ncbi:excinuclease ABC subunit UvrA [Myxococcus sp. AM009]|nr:excinuclease ABC subunit UvrA [Myxococcus sp. AM009]
MSPKSVASHSTPATSSRRDFIEVTGARENNLQNVTLRIPRGKLTVFTGVSGSGKSSLVFDTIAAEAQRQLNETYTAFVRNRLPKYGQPDVDSIDNLSAATIIDQKRLGGSSRSTVGTITDIAPLLRLLFSRVGKPAVGNSHVFSFNDPQGMCPECSGIGKTTQLDLDNFLDRSKSLNEGAILHPDFAVGKWYWKSYTLSGHFDNDKPLSRYTKDEWQMLLHGESRLTFESEGGPIYARYEGIVDRFTRLYMKKDLQAMTERNRELFLRVVNFATCPSCQGSRLNALARSCKIGGHDIGQLSAMEATELVKVLSAVDDPAGAPVVASLLERLGNLVTIGLGYLSMDRESGTLSGGESQRIKTVRHLGSSLTEMLYVFDEPSIGLHPRDVQRLNTLLLKLRDKGNTVLVVEHDPDVIAIADHIVDLGPRAGQHGGQVVYEGPYSRLQDADTLTGRFLRQELPLKVESRKRTGALTVKDARLHNLKGLTVDIPTGVLTVVTGVAGSGKSTLINEVFVAQHPGAVVIDQSAVSTSIRSNTATYTGMLDTIRQLFAKANGVSASLFSFNSEGACPGCQGLGVVYVDLAFMDGLKSICDVCAGKRFTEEVLGHELRGKNIGQVLDLTAADALAFFKEKKLQPTLQALVDVGLSYLRLGQPLSTLSGGECQRIKLATELHKQGAVYVMDEPTTGLHMSDVRHLLELIERLVVRGSTVVVIEHNLEVIKRADWILDLGLEGGHQGGDLLFEGTPRELLKCQHSITAKYLRQHVRASG